MSANSRTNNNRTRANSAKATARANGARLPQDHQQTASYDANPDIVEFEYNGNVYSVSTDDFDDLEIMETLNVSISRGLTMLLGVDQYQNLRDQLKGEDPDNRLRISKMQNFVTRMQAAVGPLG